MFKVQPLFQNDPQWKDTLLGFSDDLTIEKYGCLLTSITMVVNGLGGNETPGSLNQKMKNIDGFKKSLIVPSQVNQIYPGIKLVKRIKSPEPPAPLSEIDASLAAGMPVIVKVDYSPADGVQDHWMVIYAKQGRDYLIADPFPKRGETPPISLTERYGFVGGPGEIIKDAIWYDGKLTAPPEPPPVVKRPVIVKPSGKANVYAAADSLALRSLPLMSSNLVGRVKLGSRLSSLEPAKVTQQKLGQMNQWLRVQDDRGAQGYAAAWFLVASPADVPDAPADEPAHPEPPLARLVVYVSEDKLSLRKQPIIEPKTFIKKLPLNAELAVLEPEIEARKKIGVEDRWLQVQDVEGVQGYVAGLYVSLTQEDPAVGVTPKPLDPPAVPVTKPPVPSERKLVVGPTDSGLALRRQPVISATTLIKRLPMTADLLVVEPLEEAEKKIGIVNQWLKVRDIQNVEGYVAAWYVVKRPVAGP